MAAKFWVGGGTNTNWNSSPTTNWANSSGGTGNQTAPATGDDVTFDGSSGSAGSNWNTAISLNSLVCTGSKNTVSGVAAITISGGNFALPGGAGSTYSHSGTITFTGTTGTQTITSNGKTFSALTLNGAGGTFQLQDALSLIAGNAITLTSGTFDCQTFAVSCGNFVCSGAVTRVLKGSGTWTIGTGPVNGVIWNISGSGLTTTNFTSSITVTGSVSSSRTFTGGGLTTYGTLTVGANSSGGVLIINGANTFAALAITAPNCIAFQSAVTNTFTAPFALAGTPGSEICIMPGTVGSTATMAIGSGNATLAWCGVREITFSGGSSFTAANSFDLGHNSGITINAPPGIPAQFVSCQRGTPY